VLRLDLPSLDDLPPASNGEAGVPLQLPLSEIDEDPEQPRKEFDDESLRELAATIATRGVRSPISVRPHPVAAGRWMLNFGARRLRAAKVAGLADIPAFVDVTADSFDQIIENEQREALRPLELALFVQRQLAHGMTRTEVARRLGKSQAYLSMVCAMIDPPDWLMASYRCGKCQGLHEIYELRRLHTVDPARVEQFLDDAERVGRSDLERLRLSLESERDGLPVAEAPDATEAVRELGVSRQASDRKAVEFAPADAPPSPRRAGWILTARLGRESVRVLLDATPDKLTAVYVTTPDRQRKEAALKALTNLSLSRG